MEWQLSIDGSTRPGTSDDVATALSAGTGFWLDVTGTDATFTAFLSDVLHLHPLLAAKVARYGQRPKAQEFGDVSFLVVYGAPPAGGSAHEVHLVVGSNWVLSVHDAAVPAIDHVRQTLGSYQHSDAVGKHSWLLFRIVEAMVDEYFPLLDAFDNEIDALEDEILGRPTQEQLARLFDMKRSLIAYRRIATPQRDMFASLSAGVVRVPGGEEEVLRYFREVYDHLIRVSDLVDSLRDLLTGALDTHLASVSNRLNVVMKQLTLIATVFLPLSFLTGFFGQNFGWMVDRIQHLPQFLIFGVGLELLAAGTLIWLFRRRGWLRD